MHSIRKYRGTTGLRTFILSTLLCLFTYYCSCIFTDTNSSLINASVPVVIDQREFVLNNIREVSILICVFHCQKDTPFYPISVISNHSFFCSFKEA